MNAITDKDAYTRLYRAASRRMKIENPVDLFKHYLYGPERHNYPTDLITVLDNLDGTVALRISMGQDPIQAEREMCLLAIMFLAVHDLLHIPESCDELTGPDDDFVRILLERPFSAWEPDSLPPGGQIMP